MFRIWALYVFTLFFPENCHLNSSSVLWPGKSVVSASQENKIGIVCIKQHCSMLHNHRCIGNNSATTYLCLHVKHPTFLACYNKIWLFLTDFHIGIQYKISRQFIQWKPCWYMYAERHDDTNRQFLLLIQTCLRTHPSMTSQCTWTIIIEYVCFTNFNLIQYEVLH